MAISDILSLMMTVIVSIVSLFCAPMATEFDLLIYLFEEDEEYYYQDDFGKVRKAILEITW